MHQRLKWGLIGGGLNIRAFGETGGLRWHQETPNQLSWTPLGEPTRTLERGAVGLYPEAQQASRITVGHAEGMLGAFANIYRDLHTAILASRKGDAADYLAGLPLARAGVETIRTIQAAAQSANRDGAWIKL